MTSTTDAEARARIRGFFPPITLVLVSVPLILRLIPPNRWYGIRVREAGASDTAWYLINQLGGLAMIIAGVIWLVAATYAPTRHVKAIGTVAVLLTVFLMFWSQGWTF
jgi:uncharacterized membrane protein